jgi:hypothetical protein
MLVDGLNASIQQVCLIDKGSQTSYTRHQVRKEVSQRVGGKE